MPKSIYSVAEIQKVLEAAGVILPKRVINQKNPDLAHYSLHTLQRTRFGLIGSGETYIYVVVSALCSKCDEWKSAYDFHADSNNDTGYKKVCKSCYNNRRESVAAHREIVAQAVKDIPKVEYLMSQLEEMRRELAELKAERESQKGFTHKDKLKQI